MYAIFPRDVRCIQLSHNVSKNDRPIITIKQTLKTENTRMDIIGTHCLMIHRRRTDLVRVLAMFWPNTNVSTAYTPGVPIHINIYEQ